MTLFLLFLVLITFIFFFYKKFILIRKELNSSKMNDWMNMSSEDRFLYDIKQKRKTMQRKKILLQEIRKEYLNSIKSKK